MTIHSVILLVLIVIAVVGFFNLSNSEVGPRFLIWLLVALVSFAPIPFFAYRIYSLWRADYHIDRDSLAISWGLRIEDIPLSDIEWMRSADDLVTPLALPSLPFPGGLLGIRRHPELGVVEFLASDAKKLLLIATAKRVFVISPENPAGLSQTFARATEMGSLQPVEAKSVYPSFVVTQAWESGIARYLWLTALFLNIGLFIWASLIIPTTPLVAIGQQFAGGTLETVPSSQLIIFPVASLLLAIVGWIAGLYFYRWDRERVLAFIIWGSSTLTSLLFLLAVLFIITTPV
jgi:HAMP domain-containing protein